MSLHVLVLLESLPYPLDPRVRAQAAALRAAGHEVTVVSPAAAPGDPLDELLDGVRVRRFPAPPPGSGVARLRARVRGRLHARPWPSCGTSSVSDRVDLVLACAPPDLLVTLARPARASGRGRRSSTTATSPPSSSRRSSAAAACRIGRCCSPSAMPSGRADAVMTVSEPCAELARRRGGVDPSRVFLVGNGPDPERIHPVAPRPELRRGREHLVLWLGMMSSQENLERLVEAAEHVVHGYGANRRPLCPRRPRGRAGAASSALSPGAVSAPSSSSPAASATSSSVPTSPPRTCASASTSPTP